MAYLYAEESAPTDSMVSRGRKKYFTLLGSMCLDTTL